MYIDMDKKETNLDNLNEIYHRIREIFSNVKPQKELSIDELVQLYSHDDDFLKDLHYINQSLIDINNILDYEDVYYYKGKFYGTYLGLCDNEVFYRDTDDIVRYGIKVC